MTLHYNSLRSNAVYCLPCQNLFSGTWTTSFRQRDLFEKCQRLWNQNLLSRTEKIRFKHPPGLVRKAYRFHGTLSDLKDCGKNHCCPLCKVIVDRGKWRDVEEFVKTAYVHIERPSVLEIHFTQKGSKSTPFYKFGMSRGMLAVSIMGLITACPGEDTEADTSLS